MSNGLKKTLAIILSFSIFATFCVVPVTVNAQGSSLKFGSNGKFKIVIFADVQDQFPVHQRVINIMKQALNRENPDLVVFLGDMTEMNTKDPEDDFRRTVEQILGPVVEAGIPYAIVFGNHDDQSYFSGQRANKDELLAVYQSIGDCRTVDAEPSLTGTGTCKIPVYSSDGGSVAFDLFMVDSNTYQNPTEGNGGYDNPHADQLAWIADNKDAGVNSLVFQHIPMPEIYNLLKEDENGSKSYGDKKYAKELTDKASGYLGEYPCPPHAGDNTGEFAALKSMGGVLGVFTGHDHLNDFTGTYDGLKMTAVPGMTYLNYGEEAVRGYGVIELDENDLTGYAYNSVKFSTLDEEAGEAPETTYDVYDEVTYSDLRKDGNPLDGSSYTFNGRNDFTYNATSPSKSAIFKFRWIAGSDTGIQFSFDKGSGSNISYPFGVWVKKPNSDSAGANGAWHLKPSIGKLLVNMDSAVKEGDTFDIELGRLKVLTGASQHVGEYYIYLKVNGVLIQETYTNTSVDGEYMSGNALCQVSNIIRFADWGGYNNKISAYVEEQYAPYDVVNYSDFLDTGNNHLSKDGVTLESQNTLYHYNATSETHSAKYKFRFVAGSCSYFQMYPGVYCTNPFMYRINTGTSAQWVKRYAPDNTTVSADREINAGDEMDIEIGRLMVVSGINAGKYYSYFKVDGVTIFATYVASGDIVDSRALDDSIQFALGGTFNCGIKPSTDEEPEVEEPQSPYEAYDVIEYADFLDTGNNHLSKDGVTLEAQNTLYHYNATSETHSAIYRFRFVAGSCTYFQMYPGVYCTNPFMYRINTGASAEWVKRYAPENKTVSAGREINAGDEMDIEIGRLMVATGENAGKYHSYFKVDGEMIFETYVSSADITDSRALGDSLQFALGGTYNCGIKPISEQDPGPGPVVETYDSYDEIGYADLTTINDGNSTPAANPEGWTLSNSGKYCEYAGTSPSKSVKFNFRWTIGDVTKLSMSFDRKGSSGHAVNYMFGVIIEDGKINFRPESGGYKTDIPAAVLDTLTPGSSHDVEFTRLKVVTGSNTGKYYMYLKIDGTTIAEGYVAENVVDENGNYTSAPSNSACTLSYMITFNFYGTNGNVISAIPVDEEYETYDEILYSDLMRGGESLPADGYGLIGKNIFTYNRQSPTYSAVLKYRWIAGNPAKFSLSFDTSKADGTGSESYPFCATAKYPNQSDYGAAAGENGAWQIDPSNKKLMVNMSEPLVIGGAYDIEFGRLKVKDGPNAGKYYVYLKVDDVLIQSYYASVNEDGTYKDTKLSNNIVFSVYNSEGNRIRAYGDQSVFTHEGVRGDLDSNLTINGNDYNALKQVLFGLADVGTLPQGISDFNNDDDTDICDLIAVKKYIAPVNTYSKSGGLALGTQEHLLEDETKTAAYIADSSAVLGATSYRLSMPIHRLYSATSTNGISVNSANMAKLKEQVAALKAQGINEILYVTDSFILPYGYSDPDKNHNITVPDPQTDAQNYLAWLDVNSAAFGALAAAVPEIKYFEPFNEINLTGTRLERPGIGWNTTEQEQASYKYTVNEKAGIMADLCWYISKEVKAVDRANQVTTPSMCVGSHISTLEGTFINAFYSAIESGNYPSGTALADKRTDSYFTIVNIHAYPEYTESNLQAKVDKLATDIRNAYSTIQSHNDGGSRVWLTETGVSSYSGNGNPRNETIAANLAGLTLEKINTELTFIDTVIFYKIADISSDNGATLVESGYGLFYAGDDLDHDPYAAKPIAKTVYSFFGGGTTDYSALTALADRYN